MAIYLIRPVKMRVERYSVDEDGLEPFLPSNDTQSHLKLERIGPPIYKSHLSNEYLIELKNDNIETLRLIINNLIRAESYLMPDYHFLYVLVYVVEPGKKIDHETRMFLEFNLLAQPRTNTSVSNDGKGTPGAGAQARQTWRGSGRYEPIKQNDPPLYFQQTADDYISDNPLGMEPGDDFIGLRVVWGRITGRALTRVYMGGVGADNWHIDQGGKIGMHRFGPLLHGAFQGFRESILPVSSVFAAGEIADDGEYIETGRVVENALPTLITDFKAQRRAAHTSGGASAELKRKLLARLYDYQQEWLHFYEDVRKSPHNLNYSVQGYERTIKLYEKAEYIVRMIADHFPEQLTFDSSKVSKNYIFRPVSKENKLQLGENSLGAPETYDAMILYVEWMRKNYVDYEPMNTSALKRSECTDAWRRATHDPTERETALGGGRPKYYDPSVPDIITDRYIPERRDENSFKINHNRKSYKNGVFYLERNITSYVYTTHYFKAPMDVQWSSQNIWLEKTRGTAADIEQSEITFQINSRHFLNLVAHFESVCYPRAFEKGKRHKGKIDGEVIPTREQTLNRYRVYPKTRKEKDEEKEESEPGELSKEIPALKTLPNFCPLQVDTRRHIQRGERDVISAEDFDPQLEELDLDDEKRKKFLEDQQELEEERKKKKPKRENKWRNEVDPIDKVDLDKENGRMLDQIKDNLFKVAEGGELVLDALAIFGTGGAATPAVIIRHGAKKTAVELAKKTVKELAEDAVQDVVKDAIDDYNFEPDAIDDYKVNLDKPDAPDGQNLEKYEPPELEKSGDFTGDEDAPRNTCMEGTSLSFSPDKPYIREHSFYHGSDGAMVGNGVAVDTIEEFEERRGRKLIQRNVFPRSAPSAPIRMFGVPSPSGYRAQLNLFGVTELNPLERLRIKRLPPRLPRS